MLRRFTALLGRDNTPEDLMRVVVSTFATGDTQEAQQIIDMNYVDHQGLRGDAIAGPDGFRRVAEAARSAYSQLNVHIEELAIVDDWVAARLRWTGTPLAQTDADAERETVDVLRVAHGQVVEHW